MNRFIYQRLDILDMICSIEVFKFATELHLNLGYHHIKLDAHAQNIITIVLPWQKVKYKYTCYILV
jgi:hypothetical protein